MGKHACVQIIIGATVSGPQYKRRSKPYDNEHIWNNVTHFPSHKSPISNNGIKQVNELNQFPAFLKRKIHCKQERE